LKYKIQSGLIASQSINHYSFNKEKKRKLISRPAITVLYSPCNFF